MKKVFLFATLAVATVFNLGYIAYGKYNAMSQADKLVFENIEALSGGESNPGEYPRYKNVTDKSSNVERRFETRIDSSGVSIEVEFKRTCTTWNTYCKLTRRDDDICYGELNGIVTDCGSWSENSTDNG